MKKFTISSKCSQICFFFHDKKNVHDSKKWKSNKMETKKKRKNGHENRKQKTKMKKVRKQRKCKKLKKSKEKTLEKREKTVFLVPAQRVRSGNTRGGWGGGGVAARLLDVRLQSSLPNAHPSTTH